MKINERTSGLSLKRFKALKIQCKLMFSRLRLWDVGSSSLVEMNNSTSIVKVVEVGKFLSRTWHSLYQHNLRLIPKDDRCRNYVILQSVQCFVKLRYRLFLQNSLLFLSTPFLLIFKRWCLILILGFRHAVDKICGLLGYYAVSCGLLGLLTLEDGTDTLSRNVDKQLAHEDA
jgi:hypothetical protein